MSSREIHMQIWDIAKKRFSNGMSTASWFPEGFLTYVLFVDPATRVIDGLKSYDNVSSNIENENTTNFISNYENNEVKSQMKIEYYSQYIHIIQNNINSIIADREFEFYNIRHRNDTKAAMKKSMDKYKVMLKSKFTELEELQAKYKSFEKWFDDTKPK